MKLKSSEYLECLNLFRELLKKNNLKYTEQREVVLKILFFSSTHISAEEIYLIIKKDYDYLNVGMATIYRTLNLLEDSNFITSISFDSSGKKYELNGKEHHDHIICEVCGKIVEFYNEDIERLQEVIAQSNEFKITGHTMQIYGICKSCL